MKIKKKPWGKESITHIKDGIQFKILHINKGEETSLQYHKNKCEAIIPLDNNCTVEYANIIDLQNKQLHKKVPLKKGIIYLINSNHIHRFIAENNDTELAELSNGPDGDICRVEDKYHRNEKS
jgi:mannose-6-phosphate isomerase-like protein (cupin superfamily)